MKALALLVLFPIALLAVASTTQSTSTTQGWDDDESVTLKPKGLIRVPLAAGVGNASTEAHPNVPLIKLIEDEINNEIEQENKKGTEKGVPLQYMTPPPSQTTEPNTAPSSQDFFDSTPSTSPDDMDVSLSTTTDASGEFDDNESTVTHPQNSLKIQQYAKDFQQYLPHPSTEHQQESSQDDAKPGTEQNDLDNTQPNNDQQQQVETVSPEGLSPTTQTPLEYPPYPPIANENDATPYPYTDDNNMMYYYYIRRPRPDLYRAPAYTVFGNNVQGIGMMSPSQQEYSASAPTASWSWSSQVNPQQISYYPRSPFVAQDYASQMSSLPISSPYPRMTFQAPYYPLGGWSIPNNMMYSQPNQFQWPRLNYPSPWSSGLGFNGDYTRGPFWLRRNSMYRAAPYYDSYMGPQTQQISSIPEVQQQMYYSF